MSVTKLIQLKLKIISLKEDLPKTDEINRIVKQCCIDILNFSRRKPLFYTKQDIVYDCYVDGVLYNILERMHILSYKSLLNFKIKSENKDLVIFDFPKESEFINILPALYGTDYQYNSSTYSRMPFRVWMPPKKIMSSREEYDYLKEYISNILVDQGISL